MTTTKFTAETPAETITAHYAGLERLQDLQERYNHELMDEEERCELRDRIAAGLARMAG